MAQRQFKSDDTSLWGERFGNGSRGSTTSPVVTDAAAITTGTAGQSQLTYGGGWSGGYPLMIHQTTGTGAGNWELNYATTSVSTTMNLRYPLMNNYGAGAQMVVMWPYSSISISGTVTPPSWNGTTAGGIVALLCNGTITVSGTISVNRGNGASGNTGRPLPGQVGGLWGGDGDHVNNDGYSGGSGGQIVSVNGGGASSYQQDPWSGDGAGGGNGSAGGGGIQGDQRGAGGADVGNAGLTSMFMGGGGGGTCGEVNSTNGGGGGSGGGIIMLIAPTITITGSMTVNGGNGGGTQVGAGGGAGGSILLKGQNISLGVNKAVASGGVSGSGYGGGDGGYGRIHAYYLHSISGQVFSTALPNATYSTQDSSLTDSSFLTMF